MVEYTILSNCLHTQFHKRIEHKHACRRSYCRENFPTIFCAVVSLTLKPYIVDQHPLRSQIESCFQALELIALRRCCKKTIPGLSFSAIRKTFPTCPEMWIELNVKLFIFKIQAFSFIFFGKDGHCKHILNKNPHNLCHKTPIISWGTQKEDKNTLELMRGRYFFDIKVQSGWWRSCCRQNLFLLISQRKKASIQQDLLILQW